MSKYKMKKSRYDEASYSYIINLISENKIELAIKYLGGIY